jgi:F0F1-type ATP synthase membrane subunit a
MRDTFENWQSEFLQLIWQVVALTYLWYIGSPQSKEEEERNQEMLEWIMKNIDHQKAEEFMLELEQKYPKK